MKSPGSRLLAKKNDLRTIVENYNIKFHGPVLPPDYPEPFRDLFQQIYDISQVRYNDYDATDERDIRIVKELKVRVLKLKKDALRCRQSLANEATWRYSTEGHVLERFSTEPKCLSCSRSLRHARAMQLYQHRDSTRKHSKKRNHAQLCNCDEETRISASIKALEEDNRSLFVDVADEIISKHPHETLKSSSQLSQKPDRVIGLNLTNSLKSLTAIHPHLIHSPFRSGGTQLIYPFLVIEAKSEKGSPGFEYAEMQTALPIRTFLRIQAQLQSLVKSDFHPFIWFLAFSGEHWHVYGCTYLEDKCHIYNLWQGTILSQDKGLQLLLIMDTISDWARKYRSQVRRCLTQDVDDVHLWSPISRTHSFDDFISAIGPPTKKPRLVNTTEATPIAATSDPKNTTVGTAPAQVSNGGLLSNLTAAERNGTEFNYHMDIKRSASDRNVLVTVRHIDQVLYTFRHINLPGNDEAIRDCLKVLLPQLTFPEAALEMFGLFESSNTFLTGEQVEELQRFWIGREKSALQPNSSTHRALVLSKAFFQQPSWQPVRQMVCITCSPEAATFLKQTVDQESSTRYHVFDVQDSWNLHSTTHSHLINAVQQIKCLSREEAALSAWEERVFNLCTNLDGPDQAQRLEWDFHRTISHTSKFDDWQFFDMSTDSCSNEYQKSLGCNNSILNDYPYANFTKPDRKSYHTTITNLNGQRASLLVKPDTWPESAPELCLLLLEESKTSFKTASIELLEVLVEGENLNRALVPSGMDEYKTKYYRRVCCHWLGALKDGQAKWFGNGRIVRSCVPEELIRLSANDGDDNDV